MTEIQLLRMYATFWLAHVRGLRDDERGMTTETVILTASLAALAVAVTVIIVRRVQGEADDIQVDGERPTPVGG